MIISHKHKFIFIKTQKTAGTSIEIALSRICGPSDIITPISAEDEQVRQDLGYPAAQNYHPPLFAYTVADLKRLLLKRKRPRYFFNHISAEAIRERIAPKVWNRYFKFCFERNPYDKTISWYYWAGRRHADMNDFITSGKAARVKGFNLYTIGSLPVVDKIYRYEDISGALRDVEKKLGLDAESIALPGKRTKSSTRRDRRNYREVLTDEQAEWISLIFAREIKLVGYTY